MSMAKKPDKKNHKKYIIIITIVAIVSIMLTFIVNKSATTNKESLRNDIRTIQNSLTGSGQIIYDEQRDAGCQTGYAGFSIFTTCRITSDKFFKSQKSLESDLNSLNGQLKKMGYSPDKITTEEFKNITVSVSKTRSLLYTTATEGQPAIYVKFYNPLTDRELVRERLRIPFTDVLQDSEYIYGVSISGTHKSSYGW